MAPTSWEKKHHKLQEELRKQKADFEVRSADYYEKTRQAQEDGELYKDKAQKAEEELSKLKRNTENLQNDHATLQAQYKALIADKEQVDEAIRVANLANEATAKKMAGAETLVIELSNALESAESRENKLKHERDDLSVMNDTLHRAADEQEDTVNELTTALELAEAVKKEKEDKVDDVHQQLRNIFDDMGANSNIDDLLEHARKQRGTGRLQRVESSSSVESIFGEKSGDQKTAKPKPGIRKVSVADELAGKIDDGASDKEGNRADNKSSANQEMEKKIAQTEEKVVQLESELKKAGADLTETKDMLEKSQAKVSGNEQMEKKVAQLESDLEKAGTDLTEALRMKDLFEQKYREEMASTDAVTLRLTRASNNIGRYQDTQRTLTQERNAETAKVVKLEQELKQSKDELITAQKTLKKLGNQQQQAKKANAMGSNVGTEQIDGLQQELKQTKADLFTAQSTVRKLENQQQAAKKANATVGQMARRGDRLSRLPMSDDEEDEGEGDPAQKIAKLEDLLQRTNDALAMARSAKKMIEIDHKRDVIEVADLQNMLKRAEIHTAAIETRLATETKLREDAWEEIKWRKDLMGRKIEMAEDEIKKLEKELRDGTSQLDEIKAQVKPLNEQNGALAQQNEALTTETQALSAQIDTLKHETQALSAGHDAMETYAHRLERALTLAKRPQRAFDDLSWRVWLTLLLYTLLGAYITYRGFGERRFWLTANDARHQHLIALTSGEFGTTVVGMFGTWVGELAGVRKTFDRLG